MKAVLKVFGKGMVVVVPIGLTLYVVWWLGVSAEEVVGPLLQTLLPEDGPLEYRAGMGLLAGLAAIFIVGVLTYSVLFGRAVALVGRLLERIPLVKSVYLGVKDLMSMASRGGGRDSAGKAVMVELAPDCRLLGIITQADPQRLPRVPSDGPDRVAVYLPMSYQIGGFTLFLPKAKVSAVDLSVEDALRCAMTAAMGAAPKESATKTDAPAR